MKFIFPQNYNFKNKLLGIFDYSTIFINIFWCAIVFIIINLFIHNLNTRIFIFIFTCLPIFLFSISGINGENIIYVFLYLVKFTYKPKLFFYNKTK